MPALIASGEKLLLRYPEAAARLSVSRTTIYQLISKGELPVVRIGRSRRIPADALHVWLHRQAGGACHAETV